MQRPRCTECQNHKTGQGHTTLSYTFERGPEP
jgi:transposase-like protein